MKINTYSKRRFIIIGIVCLVFIITFISFTKLQNKKQQALYNNYINLSKESIAKDNKIEAITNLEEAIKIYPEKSQGYALRAYAYYLNNQNEEALKDTDKVLSLTKGNSAEFYSLRGDIFEEEEKIDLAIDAYHKAYLISPSDIDIVHDYVSSLIIKDQYEEAYQIIGKYFDETDKDAYWDNVDVWLDIALASLKTHRCMEAGTSAWHVLMRTKEGEDANKIAQGVISNAFDDKNCIDNDTFIVE